MLKWGLLIIAAYVLMAWTCKGGPNNPAYCKYLPNPFPGGL